MNTCAVHHSGSSTAVLGGCKVHLMRMYIVHCRQHVLQFIWHRDRKICLNLLLTYPLMNGWWKMEEVCPSFLCWLSSVLHQDSLQHLKEEATEHFDQMNCGQRRGLISLSSSKAVKSEQGGYRKCLENIATYKQACGKQSWVNSSVHRNQSKLMVRAAHLSNHSPWYNPKVYI